MHISWNDVKRAVVRVDEQPLLLLIDAVRADVHVALHAAHALQ